ncbi:helix-turn-helix domain-containing protein [Pedobacter sp. AW31-3R]|uniref:helix-turn-helix domain-containing protein n=1 Tax=Pedobacter sp. AW31-3R TaxID=3445781 RepID=UPI003F9F78AB
MLIITTPVLVSLSNGSFCHSYNCTANTFKYSIFTYSCIISFQVSFENKDSVLNSIIEKITPAELKKTRDRLRLAGTIAELLAERNMSKSQFAKFMGKEPSVVSKWLSGTHHFTMDTLSEISNYLGFPLVRFFEEKEPEIIFKSHFAITGSKTELYNRLPEPFTI